MVSGFWRRYWFNLVSKIPDEIKNDTSEWQSIESQLLKVSKPVNQDIAEWMDYGNQLWRYGRYDEAISAFNRVIELDANFDQAYYALGLTYAYQGNEDEDENKTLVSYIIALTAFQKATEINETPYYYWRQLGSMYSAYRGILYHNLKKYDLALADFYQALEIDPNNLFAVIGIGLTNYEKGELEIAIKQFNQALSLKPDLAEAQLALATTLYLRGESPKAIELAKSALKIDPKFTTLDYLKLNNWGEKLIADTLKLLTHPELQSYIN